MAIERLINTKDLNISMIDQYVSGKQMPTFFNYDQDYDALMVMFVTPDHETVVHYLDDEIALLYEPDSLNVVGIQVEAFTHKFLQKHKELSREWKLDADYCKEIPIEDVGALATYYAKRTPRVTKEVVQITEGRLKPRSRRPVYAGT